jgi:pimeloyl-ACP methyl ester carboxylesterase
MSESAGTVAAMQPSPAVQPFRVDVPPVMLDDLADRLARTRWPLPPVPGGGESAETLDRIAELIAFWQDGYDWPAAAGRLNAVPHYLATVDGVGLHLIHVRGTGPDPLPLLLTNGWPSSFVEYLDVLGPLTDPAAHGGQPEDSFSVVIPALPGYGFSDGALDRPVDRFSIAALFDRLMVEHLGYPRYVAHGDDVGGGVVNRLGMRHGASVAAIQTANWFRPVLGPGAPPLSEDERAYLAADEEWNRTEGAYAHIQATRPQILAHALGDSPAGLAAWILEKWLTWSDPATRDRLSTVDMLTNVMLYWVTGSIGSSIRLYTPQTARLSDGDVVRVPTSVLAPHEPKLPIPPESWLRRGYPDLRRFVTLDQGGHFLAAESPERFVTEIREAFRPHRG